MSRWDGSDDQGSTRWHDTAYGGALHAGAAATVTWGAAIRPNEWRGRGWRAALYAARAQDDAAEAEDNCEEKEAGIISVWASYDKSKLHRIRRRN